MKYPFLVGSVIFVLVTLIAGGLWWRTMRKNITNVAAVEKLATTSAHVSAQPADGATHRNTIHGVVIDLTKIVFITDEKASAKEIGYANSAYAWWQTPEKIRAQFYDILNAIQPPVRPNPYAIDDLGKPLPQLMTDWFCGLVSGQEIVTQIKTYFAQRPTMPQRDKDLMASIANALFNPKSFINTQRFFNEALEFAHACKKNGYELYVLSNWPTETVEQLAKKYPQFFALCDAIVLSSDLQTLLPDPYAYELFLKKIHYTHKAHHLVYIDDHHDNIEAARAYGMHGIVCPLVNNTPLFTAVRQAFEKITGEKLP